jgi:ATP-dependent HslUV protease, peptidase subunit HslV
MIASTVRRYAYSFNALDNHNAFNQVKHSTTILSVRKGGDVVIIGDGQVTAGSIICKPNAKKIRRLPNNTLTGFAGSAADCITLADRLETKLEAYPGQILRASVELAKEWRSDRALRHLSAMLIVADDKMTLEVNGSGDVMEMHDGVMSIGSGSPFARAAALALMDSDLSAREIAVKSMKIAASMCCYTNENFVIEEIKQSS